MAKYLFFSYLFLLFFHFSEKTSAQLTVSGMFSDNMVLQQSAKVNIWGWSNPGDTVVVTGSWDNIQVKAITNQQNKWSAQLQTPAAKTDGSSYTLTVSGKSKIVFSNVLIGEVWLLSGQSNMEMPLSGWGDAPVEGSAQVISSANYSNIRLFTVNRISTSTPQKDVTNSSGQKWKVCSPATVPNFSAIGYFFGRKLYQDLNIPIGLVNSSWGGSSCETWANVNSLDYVPDFAGKTPWLSKDANDNQTATVLYNGMIAPLIPYNFAGVCWYQGESNVGRAKQLTELFPALIEGWRSDFKNENLPFYFVQLAPWGGYGEGPLPEIWEAQAYALNLHHTEMAETLDCGNVENIHPAKKEPIGNRLAQKALANIYGKSTLVFAGPRYNSLKIEGNKIRLYFSHTGSGLKTIDTSLKHFEIAGSNNVFYAAEAKIEGTEVVVSSSLVPAPKNVRYAWRINATASLFNNEGFPAIPFRTNPATWIDPVKTTLLIDSELINDGEKIQLKWTTIGTDTITLNDERVSTTGWMEITPDSTTTFVLKAKKGISSESLTKTVYVIPGELKSWAKNKKTAASTIRSGHSNQLAVDENATTYWSSNTVNDQWLMLDLGETIPVKLVILQWGVGFGKTYEIQVSKDNINWSVIFTENNGNGGIDFIPNLSGEGRYVRVNGKTRSTTSNGFEISEFQIFSDETRQTGTLLDKNGNVMRGTPMVLGKKLGESVAFASDIKNWETIKNNGFNTIRVCWVDPWYKDQKLDYWKVSEVLPYLDKCVENATASGMNLIINYHGVGSQQDFDKTFTFAFEAEFWDTVAARYKDNDLVYYEIANEPTFQMSDYLKPVFRQNLMNIYNNIRKKAPERHILLFSFNTIINEIVDVVENYRDSVDWNFTSVAYHMYNSNTSAAVKTIMAYHRVMCTEWNYDFVAKQTAAGYIKQVDGFKENSQTLENIGSGWIDWRDWDDTSLNELLDTLITDAKVKNYWWGIPDAAIKVSGVKISDSKVSLNSGKTKQLMAFIYPVLAGNQSVTWSSSNSEYVSVSENGLITAKATQSKTVIITVKSLDGNFTAQCEVQVIAPEKKGAYPNGGAHLIPGTINPTHYDLGGEGVGYHDMNAANAGTGIRPEQGVDTEFRLSEGSVGGIQTGEWLEYTIDVEKEGLYNIEILFATPGSFGTFHIEFDETDKTGVLNPKPSQNYSTFRTTKIENIQLKQGIQIMRICFDFAAYNLGNISIKASIPTAINDFSSNNSFNIYPNPADDKLFVSSSKPIENYIIQTLTGQTILKGSLLNRQSIDIEELIKGSYLVSLIGNDFFKTKPFIKL